MATPSLMTTFVSDLVRSAAAARPAGHRASAIVAATRSRRTCLAYSGDSIAEHGFPAGWRVRLRCGRPDRPPRVPGDDAPRGLPLPRRPCAPAVRATPT